MSVKFQKKTGRAGGKLKPQDTDSTRLQELSLMNNTHFGAIHYDIHLDMKLNYTISRIFQEMSLTELETPLRRQSVLFGFCGIGAKKLEIVCPGFRNTRIFFDNFRFRGFLIQTSLYVTSFCHGFRDS